MKAVKACFIAIAGFGLGSCSEEAQPTKSGAFDRSAMLRHYADSLIRPDFDSLNQAALGLSQYLDQLSVQPNAPNLLQARTQWKNTYLHWMRASVWMFGPAESSLGSLRELTGTFPANEVRIEQLIAISDTSFQNFERDTRGLFALDYLLFNRSKSESQLLSDLTNAGRAAYLRALGKHFLAQTAAVQQKWIGYRNAFIASAGTDAGSSMTQLYNAFLMSYEFTKNFRLGLPLGLRPGQLQSEPDKVEALHGGQGKLGIEAHLQSIFRVYTGGFGLGFDDYVLASFNGRTLYDSTVHQWNNVIQAQEALPALSLDELVRNQSQLLKDLHSSLNRMTRFYKSEMASLLGLTITYSSNDGD